VKKPEDAADSSIINKTSDSNAQAEEVNQSEEQQRVMEEPDEAEQDDLVEVAA